MPATLPKVSFFHGWFLSSLNCKNCNKSCKVTQRYSSNTKSRIFEIQQHYPSLYIIVMSRTSFRGNLYSIVCLNIKELLARSRRHIWSLGDSNGIRTHNHLVHKLTLNHLDKLANLAKWLSARLRTKWLRVRIQFLSLSFPMNQATIAAIIIRVT